MGSNAAAWLSEPKAEQLKVDTAPLPAPNENEVVVKVEAVGLCPMDWLIQTLGNDLFPFIQYPYIGGTDIAGQVTAVGQGVTRIATGDRVLGTALQLSSMQPREGGFQKYAVLQAHMTTVVPQHVSSVDASTLPLGAATAAAALYQKDFLALDYPSVNPKPNGKTLLVWAGSSSVGSNAIQLAVASGYAVVTTASLKNFDYCKALGASEVYDYSSPSLLDDLVATFADKQCAGAFALLPGSVEVCLEVVHRSKGAKFVAMALQFDGQVPEGVKTKFVFATTIKDNEVSKIIYQDFLPLALAEKKYQIAPKPVVVGHGLEAIQPGLDKLKQGVSASKLVVTL